MYFVIKFVYIWAVLKLIVKLNFYLCLLKLNLKLEFDVFEKMTESSVQGCHSFF